MTREVSELEKLCAERPEIASAAIKAWQQLADYYRESEGQRADRLAERLEECKKVIKALINKPDNFYEDCQECGIGKHDEWRALKAFLDSMAGEK